MLVVSFFAYVGLWTYYDHTRPIALEVSEGRIHPLKTHGSIVYLTQEEADHMRKVGWLASLLLVAQGAITILGRRVRRG